MILEYGLREDVTTITAPEDVKRKVKELNFDDKQVVKKKNEQKGLDR